MNSTIQNFLHLQLQDQKIIHCHQKATDMNVSNKIQRGWSVLTMLNSLSRNYSKRSTSISVMCWYQAGWMLSCCLSQIRTVPPKCCSWHRDSSDQTTFSQSSIILASLCELSPTFLFPAVRRGTSVAFCRCCSLSLGIQTFVCSVMLFCPFSSGLSHQQGIFYHHNCCSMNISSCQEHDLSTPEMVVSENPSWKSPAPLRQGQVQSHLNTFFFPSWFSVWTFSKLSWACLQASHALSCIMAVDHWITGSEGICLISVGISDNIVIKVVNNVMKRLVIRF